MVKQRTRLSTRQHVSQNHQKAKEARRAARLFMETNAEPALMEFGPGRPGPEGVGFIGEERRGRKEWEQALDGSCALP